MRSEDGSGFRVAGERGQRRHSKAGCDQERWKIEISQVLAATAHSTPTSSSVSLHPILALDPTQLHVPSNSVALSRGSPGCYESDAR